MSYNKTTIYMKVTTFNKQIKNRKGGIEDGKELTATSELFLLT